MFDFMRILTLFERLVLAVERLADAPTQTEQAIADDEEVDWQVVRDFLGLKASSASVINRKIGTEVPEPRGTPGPRGQYRWIMADLRRFKRERHQGLAGSTSGAPTKSER